MKVSAAPPGTTVGPIVTFLGPCPIVTVRPAAVAWRGGAETPREDADVPTISQAPGADGLTARPGGRRWTKRDGSRLTNAALTANFVIVGMAAIVAIIVLIAAAA